MAELKYDIVIIGGGPAGMAAAVSAKEAGCQNILVLEREKELGGILNQCIHNGFGLHTFREELTGPEYADRYIRQIMVQEISYKLQTMVLNIESQQEDELYCITAVNCEDGLLMIRSQAVILAMGCRERPRGALNIPGYRPAGIYTAGTAQYFVNVKGMMPGREVVILGSGDIGLIMARRMTLEGANVKTVAELMPYSGGLKRNIVQCLDDFNIPLKLSTTVIEIKGKERLKSVVLAKVDRKRKPMPGTEEEITCDTLLLSCGLIPENELTARLSVDMSPVTGGPIVDNCYQTSLPGVYACGNVLHVHDLVDYVSEEAKQAGYYAAEFIKYRKKKQENIIILPKSGIRYTVPFQINRDWEENTSVKFRVDHAYQEHFISVYFDAERVFHQRKKILSPGEMEEVQLKKEWFQKNPFVKQIIFCLEREE